MEKKPKEKLGGVGPQGMMKEIETAYHILRRPFKSLAGSSQGNSRNDIKEYEVQMREVEFRKAQAQADAYRMRTCVV
jgi:hypothetical protein